MEENVETGLRLWSEAVRFATLKMVLCLKIGEVRDCRLQPAI